MSINQNVIGSSDHTHGSLLASQAPPVGGFVNVHQDTEKFASYQPPNLKNWSCSQISPMWLCLGPGTDQCPQVGCYIPSLWCFNGKKELCSRAPGGWQSGWRHRNQADIGREGLEDQWVKEPAVLSSIPSIHMEDRDSGYTEAHTNR